jgi:hypothetical protein
MSPRRLRAPAGDGGLLAEPPLGRARELAATNRSLLDAWNDDIQGLPASTLRREARAAVLRVAGVDPGAVDPDSPWIVTGHQPELFHPGVWVKNFATGSLARDLGGFGLHLVVDNDLPKAAAIRVPGIDPRTARLRLVSLPFDSAAPEVPYEDWTIADEPLFQSFCRRVLERLGGIVEAPLIEQFWPRVLAVQSRPIRPGPRFAHARAEIERRWGLHLPQASLGGVCDSPPFLRYAIHLLADAERFRAIHNDALSDHRRLNHIRSKNHPVPELGEQEGWVETPFWTWTRAEPRRRPLMARRDRGTLALRPAGRPPFVAGLPLHVGRSADQAIEQLSARIAEGLRIRTRALTTTMFARLFLGDLFVHGIGGAKYDELGDVILSRFFHLAPPAYLVLSQTVWLGLPDFPGSEQALRAARALARDLRFNPERHLHPDQETELANCIERKHQLIQQVGANHRERVARWRALRACNEEMERGVAQALAEVEDRITRLAVETEWNRVAHHRDLSFVLHRPDRLLSAFASAGIWP